MQTEFNQTCGLNPQRYDIEVATRMWFCSLLLFDYGGFLLSLFIILFFLFWDILFGSLDFNVI